MEDTGTHSCMCCDTLGATNRCAQCKTVWYCDRYALFLYIQLFDPSPTYSQPLTCHMTYPLSHYLSTHLLPLCICLSLPTPLPRECQTKHWKLHKLSCVKKATYNKPNSTASNSNSKVPDKSAEEGEMEYDEQGKPISCKFSLVQLLLFVYLML